jgi:hypothetical protein
LDHNAQREASPAMAWQARTNPRKKHSMKLEFPINLNLVSFATRHAELAARNVLAAGRLLDAQLKSFVRMSAATAPSKQKEE